MAAAGRFVPCLKGTWATWTATPIRAEVGAPLPLPPSPSPSPRGFCARLGQWASGLLITSKKRTGRALCMAGLQGSKAGHELKRVPTSSGKASLEPRDTTGNVQSDKHQVLIGTQRRIMLGACKCRLSRTRTPQCNEALFLALSSGGDLARMSPTPNLWIMLFRVEGILV